MRPLSSKLAALPVLLCLTALPAAPSTLKTVNLDSPAVARSYEVRLRKLHLVRPDLIPFPIMFEVYC